VLSDCASTALDVFRADVAETNAKLGRLQEKLEEIEAQKKEASDAIQASQRVTSIQKNGTRAEVFRLRGAFVLIRPCTHGGLDTHLQLDELAALEELHLWHTARLSSDLYEFVYAARFCVRVPATAFEPRLTEVSIARTAGMPPKFKDQFPVLTDLAIALAQQHIASAPRKMSIQEVRPSLPGSIPRQC